jgi:hypothetical protein
MLARRGFRPRASRPDVPFPPDLDPAAAAGLTRLLRHYGFRLFMRGAIQRSGGFAPRETTRYLTASQARDHADALVELGLAAGLARGRYRLLWPATSFGGVLEWYVSRELRRRLGFDVASGQGVGGDLDVVAAAEGKLVCLELKSSPPKHLSRSEVSAFFERLRALRPDVSVFALDTALRLSDKVVPMLTAEIAADSRAAFRPRRVGSQLWALTPHLYAVNAKPDLIANIARAIGAGLRALAPPSP